MRIACRLPHGLIIENPLNPKQTVTLNGANKAILVGTNTGFTDVPDDFLALWKASNPEFPALKNGAIYEADGHDQQETLAREKDGDKTGFEATDPKAFGVKKADAD